MEKLIGRNIKVSNPKHPHFGEEGKGIEVKQYKSIVEPALVIQNTVGKFFCIFDITDIEVSK